MNGNRDSYVIGSNAAIRNMPDWKLHGRESELEWSEWLVTQKIYRGDDYGNDLGNG